MTSHHSLVFAVLAGVSLSTSAEEVSFNKDIRPLLADDDHIIFKSSSLEDGTLLVLTRLVYAPDGGEVVVVEDEVPEDAAESEQAEANTVSQSGKTPGKTGK